MRPFCSAFSLFEREQPLLYSDALIKNRWTHSEGALINVDWYKLSSQQNLASSTVKQRRQCALFI